MFIISIINYQMGEEFSLNNKLTEDDFEVLIKSLSNGKKYVFYFKFDDGTHTNIPLNQICYMELKSLLMNFHKEFDYEYDDECFTNCKSVISVKIKELIATKTYQRWG